MYMHIYRIYATSRQWHPWDPSDRDSRDFSVNMLTVREPWPSVQQLLTSRGKHDLKGFGP